MLKKTLFVAASAIAVVASSSLPAAASGCVPAAELTDILKAAGFTACQPEPVPEPTTVLGLVGVSGVMITKKMLNSRKA